MPGVPYRGKSRQPSPPKPQAGGKDLWDKIAALTIPFVTLTLGLLGAYATSTYNQTSLAQQNTQMTADREQRQGQADADLAMRTQQAEDAKLLAHTQQLEKMFAYISSPDIKKREFGYAMFAALGEEALALNLMRINRDPAGIKLATSLRSNADPAIRDAAEASLQSLLNPAQRSALGTAIQRFEGGRYDLATNIGNDAMYGIRTWSARTGDIQRIVTSYCADRAARVQTLCDGTPIHAPLSAERLAQLKEAGADPAMHRVQDALAKGDVNSVANRAEAFAKARGVRLPLSVAILADTTYNMGTPNVERFASQADGALGGSPASGIDEKKWIAQFIARRRAYYVQRFPQYGGLLIRVAYWEALIAAGDWDMKSAEAQSAPKD
jgi:hypothetical protein